MSINLLLLSPLQKYSHHIYAWHSCIYPSVIYIIYLCRTITFALIFIVYYSTLNNILSYLFILSSLRQYVYGLMALVCLPGIVGLLCLGFILWYNVKICIVIYLINDASTYLRPISILCRTTHRGRLYGHVNRIYVRLGAQRGQHDTI